MAALTITHVKSVTIADFTGTVTVGNSSGGTSTALATNLVRPSDWNSAHVATFSLSAADVASLFNAGNGLSISTTTSGVTISAIPVQHWEPFVFGVNNYIDLTQAADAWYFDPMFVPNGLVSGKFQMFDSRNSSHFLNTLSANSTSLGGYSITAAFRNMIAIYSQGTGSDATRINSLWTGKAEISATQSQTFAGATSGMTVSNYLTVGLLTNVDISGGSSTSTQTASGTFSTGTTSMAATKADSLITAGHAWFTGLCVDLFPFASTLAPGAYWLAYMQDTTVGGGGTTGVNRTSSGTWFNASQTRIGFNIGNFSQFKHIGQATSANSSSQAHPFQGSLLTTTTAATASLGSANLVARTIRQYVNFIQGTVN